MVWLPVSDFQGYPKPNHTLLLLARQYRERSQSEVARGRPDDNAGAEG
jgi:hypothetical protein